MLGSLLATNKFSNSSEAWRETMKALFSGYYESSKVNNFDPSSWTSLAVLLQYANTGKLSK
jgi:hypothetical protein